jgi:hypothetical protein
VDTGAPEGPLRPVRATAEGPGLPPPPSPGPDTDPVEDPDTDPADTDPVDTDEPDPDTGPVRDLAGTLTWEVWEDGTRTCEAILTFEGDLDGACAGCDATWELDLVDAVETGGCDLSRRDTLPGHRVAYARSWVDPRRGLRFRNAVLSGLGDGTWWAVERDDDPRGTTTYTRSRLAWRHDRTWGRLDDLPDDYDDCGVTVPSRAAPAALGTAVRPGEVPCDGTAVDGWTVTAPPGGARLTVDTTDPGLPFDPYLWVNDETGCTVYESDDALACTHPPPSYGCPSLDLPEGTWTVFVGSRGQCTAGPAPYELRVDGATPSLLHDERITGAVTVFRTRVDAEFSLR